MPSTQPARRRETLRRRAAKHEKRGSVGVAAQDAIDVAGRVAGEWVFEQKVRQGRRAAGRRRGGVCLEGQAARPVAERAGTARRVVQRRKPGRWDLVARDKYRLQWPRVDQGRKVEDVAGDQFGRDGRQGDDEQGSHQRLTRACPKSGAAAFRSPQIHHDALTRQRIADKRSLDKPSSTRVSLIALAAEAAARRRERLSGRHCHALPNEELKKPASRICSGGRDHRHPNYETVPRPGQRSRVTAARGIRADDSGESGLYDLRWARP
jgi:hypothetical protein